MTRRRELALHIVGAIFAGLVVWLGLALCAI